LKPYIFVFDLKIAPIGKSRFSKMIAFSGFLDLSSFDQATQDGFYTLYKASAPDPS